MTMETMNRKNARCPRIPSNEFDVSLVSWGLYNWLDLMMFFWVYLVWCIAVSVLLDLVNLARILRDFYSTQIRIVFVSDWGSGSLDLPCFPILSDGESSWFSMNLSDRWRTKVIPHENCCDRRPTMFNNDGILLSRELQDMCDFVGIDMCLKVNIVENIDDDFGCPWKSSSMMKCCDGRSSRK